MSDVHEPDIHERLASVEKMLDKAASLLGQIKMEVNEAFVPLSEQPPDLEGLDFAHRLRRLRGWRKMNQDALAEATGLSTSALNKLEHGKTQPRMKNIGLMAEALNVPFEWLDLEN